jgi:Zn-finger nucleic acid-binding protein
MATPFDCPRCGAVLTMTERHGIEIDYCPNCRGVWLDRGELDKIVERVAAPPPSGQPAGGWTQPQPPAWGAPQPRYRDDDDWDDRRKGQYGKSRKHWLSELFD